MLLNRWGLFCLFISAYTPLFLVLIIEIANTTMFTNSGGLTLITILFLIEISVYSLLFLNDFLKRAQKFDGQITNVKIEETKNDEYVIFIMTYLVPFFGININISSLVALVVLFLIIGYIYVNSSLFRVNPVLNIIWKYNIYQGNINGETITVLSRERCRGNNTLKLIKIDGNIYLNKEAGNENGEHGFKRIIRKFRAVKSVL